MTHSVPIDRSLWSPSSQRSSGGQYDAAATLYEGIAFRCQACGANSVFTAEAQQRAFEVEKKFISWFPTLCESCYAKRVAMQARGAEFQARWNENRELMAADARFLEDWRLLLKDLRALGKPNDSIERMLVKAIHALPPKA